MIQENFILVAIAYYFISIFSIVIVLILIDKQEKKKLKQEIENLEREKNLIMSSSILTELNKVKALAKNNELKQKYKSWKDKFEMIKKTDLSKISDYINEIDLLFMDNDHKKLKEVIFDCELKINSLKTKTDFLLQEIKEVTLSEERNRETITKLKAEYREIVQAYKDDLKSYEVVKKPIELQFENVEKLFLAFEDLMDQNQYTEVGKIVKAIDDIVTNLKIIIKETKEIEALGKRLIPKKIEDITYYERQLKRDNYNLDYLNIEYNIEEANKKIVDIFQRLNVLNVENSLLDLKVIFDYLGSLFSDFEKEKISKVKFDECSKNLILRSVRLERLINELIKKIDDIRYSFDLSDDEISIIYGIKDELSNIRAEADKYVEINRAKALPYSKLSFEVELLSKKLLKTEEKLNIVLRTIGNLKNDEIRAKEQLVEIKKILFNAKEMERSYKLPDIPKNYYIEISESMQAIDILEEELGKRPISIKTLNLRVDTARDLTLKVYNTINEAVKTAKMAESAIVYGNRYKPVNKEVNFNLLKAEALFFKGNYKQSLELSINAINIIEPGIHNKLLEEYK